MESEHFSCCLPAMNWQKNTLSATTAFGQNYFLSSNQNADLREPFCEDKMLTTEFCQSLYKTMKVAIGWSR